MGRRMRERARVPGGRTPHIRAKREEEEEEEEEIEDEDNDGDDEDDMKMMMRLIMQNVQAREQAKHQYLCTRQR